MMKNKLTQPLLVLTYGYPGSGKSFFASRFAKEYGLVHISGDRIRYELFDDPQHTPEETQVVYRLMDYMLEQSLKSGSGVVYDANNNKRSIRLQKKSLAEKFDAIPLMIWTQTDINTSFARSSKRDRRRPDDRYAFSMPKEAFIRLKDQMMPPRYEDYVVISGKHDFPAQLKTVNVKLKNMKILATVKSTESRFGRQTETDPVNPRRQILQRRRKINL